MKTYFMQDYTTTATVGIDSLTLNKCPGTEWSEITMSVNDNKDTITLRSKQMVEHLHFMLGQMLGK
jgi:hypothetical protein